MAGSGLGSPQGEHEACPRGVSPGLRSNLTAVALYDRLADREPDPCPLVAGSTVEALEGLKDLRALLGLDPDAVVLNRDLEAPVARAGPEGVAPAGTNQSSADLDQGSALGVAKLERVPDQVHQHSPQLALDAERLWQLAGAPELAP